MQGLFEWFQRIKNSIVLGWHTLMYEFGVGEDKD